MTFQLNGKCFSLKAEYMLIAALSGLFVLFVLGIVLVLAFVSANQVSEYEDYVAEQPPPHFDKARPADEVAVRHDE